MNPLYNMLMQNQAQNVSGQMFQNPVQKMQYIIQAMTNPAAFVKQNFPDIPEDISNDPQRILRYLQQTRGISNEQIQQLSNMYGGPR